MARRKKSPAVVPVEAVIWNDAQIQSREKLDTSPCRMHTVGFLVHEDATQIILAHEVESNEDWIGEDMDYTKIPLSLIITRVKLAEVAILKEESDP